MSMMVGHVVGMALLRRGERVGRRMKRALRTGQDPNARVPCVHTAQAHPWAHRARSAGRRRVDRGVRVGASYASFDVTLPVRHGLRLFLGACGCASGREGPVTSNE